LSIPKARGQERKQVKQPRAGGGSRVFNIGTWTHQRRRVDVGKSFWPFFDRRRGRQIIKCENQKQKRGLNPLLSRTRGDRWLGSFRARSRARRTGGWGEWKKNMQGRTRVTDVGYERGGSQPGVVGGQALLRKEKNGDAGTSDKEAE